MKIVNLLKILGVFLVMHTLTYADACFVIDNNYHYDRTLEQTYRNNRCSRGYHKLKKLLKKEAKDLCTHEYGSHGLRLFCMKKWTKYSCIKNRRSGHRTTVTVTGRFYAQCR